MCRAALYTAKTQYRNFETNIPRKGIAWPPSQCVSVIDLYIPTIHLPFMFQENMWTDPGNLEMASQTHECGTGTEATQFLSGNK